MRRKSKERARGEEETDERGPRGGHQARGAGFNPGLGSSVPLRLCPGAREPEPRAGQAERRAEGAGQAWAHEAQLGGGVADGTGRTEAAHHGRKEARGQQGGRQRWGQRQVAPGFRAPRPQRTPDD